MCGTGKGVASAVCTVRSMSSLTAQAAQPFEQATMVLPCGGWGQVSGHDLLDTQTRNVLVLRIRLRLRLIK